jgi:hypothetical protein
VVEGHRELHRSTGGSVWGSAIVADPARGVVHATTGNNRTQSGDSPSNPRRLGARAAHDQRLSGVGRPVRHRRGLDRGLLLGPPGDQLPGGRRTRLRLRLRGAAGSRAARDPATGQVIRQTADPSGSIDLGPVTVTTGVVYAPSMAGRATDKNMSRWMRRPAPRCGASPWAVRSSPGPRSPATPPSGALATAISEQPSPSSPATTSSTPSPRPDVGTRRTSGAVDGSRSAGSPVVTHPGRPAAVGGGASCRSAPANGGLSRRLSPQCRPRGRPRASTHRPRSPGLRRRGSASRRLTRRCGPSTGPAGSSSPPARHTARCMPRRPVAMRLGSCNAGRRPGGPIEWVR